MSEHKSPLRCITCYQPLPQDVEHIHYFSQCSLSPEDDDADGLLVEVQDLSRYMHTLFQLLFEANASSLDDQLLHNCHELALDLAEEATRRTALALDALRLREERQREQAQASNDTLARKEG
jgi:hypothetical protein